MDILKNFYTKHVLKYSTCFLLIKRFSKAPSNKDKNHIFSCVKTLKSNNMNGDLFSLVKATKTEMPVPLRH